MRPWCAFGGGVFEILRLTRERGILANRTRPIHARWLHGRSTFLVVGGMLMDLVSHGKNSGGVGVRLRRMRGT